MTGGGATLASRSSPPVLTVSVVGHQLKVPTLYEYAAGHQSHLSRPDGTGIANLSYTSSNPQCTGSLTQNLAIAQGGQMVKTANVNPNVAQLSGDWVRQ